MITLHNHDFGHKDNIVYFINQTFSLKKQIFNFSLQNKPFPPHGLQRGYFSSSHSMKSSFFLTKKAVGYNLQRPKGVITYELAKVQ